MARSESIYLAIGGGDISGSKDILDEIFAYLGKRRDPRIVIMTVATNIRGRASDKYNSIFRRDGVSHVGIVDIWERKDAFNKASLKKIEQADAIFFTGGDQKNITGLMGGSPMDEAMRERIEAGVMIAGTSAGAAMMSGSMIVGGDSADTPCVGCVELAPGMGLIGSTIIDTHFSQRGRHGRLLTAVAHHPHLVGIGLDENTAIRVTGSEFKVLGEGSVTVIDASKTRYSDLALKQEDEPIAMFDVCMHLLPREHSYDLANRQPTPTPNNKRRPLEASG